MINTGIGSHLLRDLAVLSQLLEFCWFCVKVIGSSEHDSLSSIEGEKLINLVSDSLSRILVHGIN
jgi:hypothetical protein